MCAIDALGIAATLERSADRAIAAAATCSTPSSRAKHAVAAPEWFELDRYGYAYVLPAGRGATAGRRPRPPEAGDRPGPPQRSRQRHEDADRARQPGAVAPGVRAERIRRLLEAGIGVRMPV